MRIHVERVIIALLRSKYTIFADFRGSPNEALDSQVPIIDRIVRVCSALVNLCPAIVPLD